jgi:hypothetical protein
MPQRKSRAQYQMSNKGIGLLILVIAVGGLGILLLGNYVGWWSIAQPTTPPTTEFDISVMDGMTGKTLPNGDFNYTLLGTDNLDDWLEFEEIKEGDSLSEISASIFADPDNEYANYVVKYVGLVEHDDDLYGEDYDWGDRAYYERWDIIDPSGNNVLVAYQTPSDADFVTVNSESFAIIDLATANVSATTNFTIIAGSNATQEDAIYMSGANYQNEQDDYVVFQIQFNDTVSLSEFAVKGASKLRANSTTINYRVGSLGPTATSYICEWDHEAEDIEVVGITMLFSETEIASHAP